VSVLDEGYSRNASCALDLISTFLLKGRNKTSTNLQGNMVGFFYLDIWEGSPIVDTCVTCFIDGSLVVQIQLFIDYAQVHH